MKTAVLISGQARTFAQVWENQYFNVYRKLENPEFFVSVEDDKQAYTMGLLRERFPKDRVHIELVKQPQIPEPPATKPHQYGYGTAAKPQDILRQLWALDRVFDFFTEKCSGDYGTVVRIRPDLRFLRFDLSLNSCKPSSHQCFTPWWSRWGGINDRVAVMGLEAALAYFSTFQALNKLLALGAPLHPETLIYTNLTEEGVPVSHTLATEFIAVRLDGTTTQVDPTPIDIAEYGRTGQ